MKKNIAVLFLVFSMVFISCDQDFNTIGADLVGDEHFDFDVYNPKLKAFSKATDEVQTNNLSINPLGIYNNPYFGETKANFVTQLIMSTSQPKFGTSLNIENVILYVPYFSSVKTINADTSREYTLDSIYGTNKESKIKLSVFENGYVLSSFDGANQDVASKYFSNGTSNANNLPIDFDGLKRGHDASGNSIQNGTRLNDSPNVAENDEFFFNKQEIVVYKTKFNTISLVQEFVDASGEVTTDPTKYVVKERLAPGIYLTLNKAFFKKKILDASANNLLSNNNFRDYFKGLFFKTEQSGTEEGAMAMLNFNNAKISLNYSSINEGAASGAVATSKTFEMAMGYSSNPNDSRNSSTTVSLQNFTQSSNFTNGLAVSNQTTGNDVNLFLKGGEGSVVYMDVFGEDVLNADLSAGSNGIPDELEAIRKNGWLINDAYIEFYVDQAKMSVNSKNQEAERLYLFDATNQKPLIDYTFDTSTGENAKSGKLLYGGIVERDKTTGKKAVKYKIRITQHINNLINSTNVNVNKNVRLGLSVTESIGITNNFYFKNPFDINVTPSNLDDDIKFFPVASIMAQQGIVLHGTNSTDADKKLKVTIHYTKPN